MRCRVVPAKSFTAPKIPEISSIKRPPRKKISRCPAGYERQLDYVLDPTGKRHWAPEAGGQGGPASDMPRTYAEASKADAEREAAKKTATDQATIYTKRYADVQRLGSDMADEVKHLEALKSAIRNKDFYSGFMADNVEKMDTALKSMGLSEGNRASLMQYAKKLGSTGSLENIREMAAFGAVRIPEMGMIEKSNFDIHNTPDANVGAIETRIRALKRGVQLRNDADEYADSHNGTIDAKFFSEQRKRNEAKPIFTDEEIANPGLILGVGKKEAAQSNDAVERARAAIAAGAPRDKVIERLKGAGHDTSGL